MPYVSFTGRSEVTPGCAQDGEGPGGDRPSFRDPDGAQFQRLMRDLGLGGQPAAIDLPES